MFDHDEDWYTCAISDYALARVRVGVFSLSEPVAAEDGVTFSARDCEEEEVVSRNIIRDREWLGSRSTTRVSLKTAGDDVNL